MNMDPSREWRLLTFLSQMQCLFEGGAYLSKYVAIMEILLDNAANYFMFFLSEPSSETKTPLSHQYSSNIESSSR